MSSVKAMRERVKVYIETADENVVKKIYAMIEADADSYWWSEMPDDVKAEVEEAMLQGDRGEGISHEEVKKRHSQWFVR